MASLPSLVSCLLLAVAPAEPTAPPNVMVRVSGKLINEAASRPVEREQPVEEEILGTMYYGHSITRGQLQAELIPESGQGAVDLVLRGTTYARTIGWRGNYLAYIHTCIPFEARKRITIDGKQILLHPATASATASSQILDMTNLRGQTGTLRVRLAWSMGEEMKPQVEAITAYRAQCRLADQLDKDSYESPARGARTLESALASVRKSGLSPRPPQWSSTKDYMQVSVAVPVSETVAPPPESASAADVLLGIHPSIINEQAEILLGGQDYSIFDLGDILKRFLIPILREGDLDPQLANVEKLKKSYRDLNLQPPTIRFPKRRPVVFAITEEGFSVTLQGVRENGDESAMDVDIKVAYRAEKTEESFTAIRQGTVTVTGGSFLSRTRLQAAFSAFFPERLTLDTLAIPVSSQEKSIRLVSSGFTLKDGWLLLAWVRKKETAP